MDTHESTLDTQPSHPNFKKPLALYRDDRMADCKGCGNPFHATYKSKKYCDACPPSKRPKHGSNALVERPCAACGKPFMNRNQRFRVCGEACSIEYKRMVKNKPILPRACVHCGTIFTPAGNHRKCYCSTKCASRASYQRSTSGATTKKKSSCQSCGEPFVPYNSMHVMCKVCSPSHRVRNQEIARKCRVCDGDFMKAGSGNHRICAVCRESHPKRIPYNSEAPCKNCGKHFKHVNKRASFCSTACSSKFLNINGQGVRHNDEELHAHLVSVIQSHEGSLSFEDLLFEGRTAPEVLARRGWTIQSLYEDAGRTYGPPRFCSYLEDRVFEVLRSLIPDSEIKSQKDLPGMLGIKDGQQFTDFFIEDYRLIVEADGNIHRDPIFGVENLEYIQANDRKKDEYARNNGFTLVRIKETLNRRAIKAQLLRGIRRAHPRFNPFSRCGELKTSGTNRRTIVRSNTRDRPSHR